MRESVQELVAEFAALGDFPMLTRAVGVEPATRVVTFYRCHFPQRFFSWGPDQEFRCRVDQVRGVCWTQIRGLGRTLEIVTPSGRAWLPERADGFEPVRAALVAGLSPDARLRWYEHPASRFAMLLAVILPGGVVGAVAMGWALERRLMSDAVAVALVIGVAAFAVVLPWISWCRGRPLS